MKVFCPNCGTENEGTPGSRVTCRACTASFEVPFEQGAAAPTPAPSSNVPSFGGRPVQPLGQTPPPAAAPPSQNPYLASPPVRPPPPAPVQPPPNVWSPNAPGSFSAPPQPGGITNGMAIASLVCGIVGCCLPFANLAAIITGVVALNQINAGGNSQKGREMAIGGIVLGGLSCLMSVGWLILSALSK
jgi:hypothetical protein